MPPVTGHDETYTEITATEFNAAAKTLKRKTSLGSYGITNEIVRCFAKCHPEILLKMYNKCITEGHFPITWKAARLTLLRKGDKPLEAPSSYRPHCILNCFGKLFEKLVDTRLRAFLEDNNGLNPRQFGFRKGHSTTDALSTLREIMDKSGLKEKIGVVTLDIQNAFNSAPWSTITEALSEKEVSAYIQHVMRSYLEDRTLIISAGSTTSEVTLTSGVPQGSVIGPTLWNILYDGLLQIRLQPDVSFLAFADDDAIVAMAKDTIALEDLLAEATKKAKEWLAKIGLKIEIQKSEALVITTARTHNNISITIDGETNTSKESIKYVGLHIHQKLNFTIPCFYTGPLIGRTESAGKGSR